jgi:hypothetical protein
LNLTNQEFFKSLEKMKRSKEMMEKSQLLWRFHSKIEMAENYGEYHMKVGVMEPGAVTSGEPLAKGGFLEALGCHWRVSQPNILILSKNSRDLCPPQQFESNITHV